MSEPQTETSPTLTVHILKEGQSFCKMAGVPASWPDHHLYVSYQDQENAKEANCPGCVAARDAGPHLAERLNGDGADLVGVRHVPVVFPSGGGGVAWAVSPLPAGVVFEERTLDAFEEKTGQAAHFDVDLGRWSKIG